MKNVSISDAKSHFSEYLSRAASGERFVIHRRGRPVAALVGIEGLHNLESAAKAARRLAQAIGQDKHLLEAVESGEAHPVITAFGLWSGDEELKNLV
jgi:prevent-host-death family protein